MAGVGCFPIKMKRKDLDDVNDDFSDFSLSSPARKIRRLDVGLPPIMEEEEAEIRYRHEQSLAMTGDSQHQHQHQQQLDRVMEDDFDSSSSVNQERAIVLFKPVNTNLFLHSPSNFSLSVDSDLLPAFQKAQYPWSLAEEEGDTDKRTRKDHMSVVPWVPSQFPVLHAKDEYQVEVPELMEAEEMGEAAMDIEDSNGPQMVPSNVGVKGWQGLPQWQQQHCMVPELPQITATPITWLE